MIFVFSNESKQSHLEDLLMVRDQFMERNEDYNHCVRRERAKEIMDCRENNIPYIVLTDRKFRGIHDDDNDSVIDTNIELSSLPERFTYIPRWRCPLPLPKSFQNATPLVSDDHEYAVTHWPNRIKEPDYFLNRSLHEISHRQFNFMMREGALDYPFFIKGVEKGSLSFSLHHVINNEDELMQLFKTAAEIRAQDPRTAHLLSGIDENDYIAYSPGRPWYCPYRDQEILGEPQVFIPKDGLIISEVMDIESRKDKTAEFRAFIVHGEVANLSAYEDYDSVQVPVAIRDLADEFATLHFDLAPVFVADFAMTSKGPSLVELNGFTYSGRYIDNDPKVIFQAITSDHSWSHLVFKAPLEIKAIEPEATPFDDAIRLRDFLGSLDPS